MRIYLTIHIGIGIFLIPLWIRLRGITTSNSKCTIRWCRSLVHCRLRLLSFHHSNQTALKLTYVWWRSTLGQSIDLVAISIVFPAELSMLWQKGEVFFTVPQKKASYWTTQKSFFPQAKTWGHKENSSSTSSVTKGIHCSGSMRFRTPDEGTHGTIRAIGSSASIHGIRRHLKRCNSNQWMTAFETSAAIASQSAKSLRKSANKPKTVLSLPCNIIYGQQLYKHREKFDVTPTPSTRIVASHNFRKSNTRCNNHKTSQFKHPQNMMTRLKQKVSQNELRQDIRNVTCWPIVILVLPAFSTMKLVYSSTAAFGTSAAITTLSTKIYENNQRNRKQCCRRPPTKFPSKHCISIEKILMSRLLKNKSKSIKKLSTSVSNAPYLTGLPGSKFFSKLIIGQ